MTITMKMLEQCKIVVQRGRQTDSVFTITQMKLIYCIYNVSNFHLNHLSRAGKVRNVLPFNSEYAVFTVTLTFSELCHV